MIKKQLLLCFLAVSLPLQLGAFTEYQLKAAFMYNVAKFVKWEPMETATDESDIRLCILGDDPFEESIDAIRSKTINQRSLNIKNFSSLDFLGDCHIVFISRSEEKGLPAILKRLKGENILTISDIDGFSDKGGMVELAMNANKIKLEINLDNLQEEDIQVSAKLLEIAKAAKR